MAYLKLLLVLSITVAVAKSDGAGGAIQPTEGTKTFPPNTTSSMSPTITTTLTPNTKTPNTTTTTTHAPSPNTTTAAPTTHAPSPNTTTAAPTTHAPSPNTTTAAPTTHAPSLNTTTAAPTTHAPSPNTTTAAPTTHAPSPNTTTVAPTTPKPSPVPDPKPGNWSVDYPSTNHSCMVMDAAIQIEILANNSSQKINVPLDATATGNCGNATDSLTLNWGKHTLEFDFDRNVNESKFELDVVKAVLVNLNLPDVGVKNYTLYHKKSEFGTPLGNSYKCKKVQTLNLTEEHGNATIAMLHVSQVQMQAFTNVTDHKFGSAVDCEASAVTSDVVPIVVGCVLAALVIMITVAYLVARRRCQSRGYLSM